MPARSLCFCHLFFPPVLPLIVYGCSICCVWSDRHANIKNSSSPSSWHVAVCYCRARNRMWGDNCRCTQPVWDDTSWEAGKEQLSVLIDYMMALIKAALIDAVRKNWMNWPCVVLLSVFFADSCGFQLLEAVFMTGWIWILLFLQNIFQLLILVSQVKFFGLFLQFIFCFSLFFPQLKGLLQYTL